MMSVAFDKGIAFICEGDTEKEFYLSLLEYLSAAHRANFERLDMPTENEFAYRLRVGNTVYLVKFSVVNSIYALPRAGRWFQIECVQKYAGKRDWIVFLCYDTDNYMADITPFQKGDWNDLRTKLGKARAIIDLAASADIEDILLIDIDGICAFLHCPPVGLDTLNGRKGTAKLKQLFRDNGCSYHKGCRARPLIDALDKRKMIDSNIIPLCEVERLFLREE